MSDSTYGTMEMSPQGPFEAGTHTTLTFAYTVGDAGLKQGGRLRIATPNQGWGEPLVLCPNPIEELVRGPDRRHNPWKPINTTFDLQTDTDAWVRMWTEERWVAANLAPKREGWAWALGSSKWRWWIVADVEVADFEPGDRIVITYGDTEDQPFGIRVQPWPEEEVRGFLCVVDVEGDGELREVSGTPIRSAVVSGPPERIVAVAPSIVAPGEAFTVRASVLDRNLTHPCAPYSGPIVFSPKGDVLTVPDADSVQEGDARALANGEACKPGIGAVRMRTDVGEGESNPVLVLPEKRENLYWGDIHAQSRYHVWNALEGRGASTRTPAELYQYARECSLLDFVANANSTGPFTGNPGWEETQQATIDAYEPGRFVTFKAWERGGSEGDRCMIYREADVEPNFPNPKSEDLFRLLRESGYRIITIPHHFMKHRDWEMYDPEFDRVIEVYSCWGSYESREDNPLNTKRQPRRQSAMYAFGLGLTPGMIAAGDSHVGYPGRSLMYSDPNWCQNWKAGLAAVYAPELTREAVWDALYDRRCYGTTGVRIVVQFSLNGSPMGSILEYPPEGDPLCRREIEVSICGTDWIRRVDVVKNNGLFHRVCPQADRVEFSVVDQLDAPPGTRDWYYIRVFQADGNAAWSSPIWIGPEGVTTPSQPLAE